LKQIGVDNNDPLAAGSPWQITLGDETGSTTISSSPATTPRSITPPGWPNYAAPILH
jgi:hypothetical protein